MKDADFYELAGMQEVKQFWMFPDNSYQGKEGLKEGETGLVEMKTSQKRSPVFVVLGLSSIGKSTRIQQLKCFVRALKYKPGCILRAKKEIFKAILPGADSHAHYLEKLSPVYEKEVTKETCFDGMKDWCNENLQEVEEKTEFVVIDGDDFRENDKHYQNLIEAARKTKTTYEFHNLLKSRKKAYIKKAEDYAKRQSNVPLIYPTTLSIGSETGAQSIADFLGKIGKRKIVIIKIDYQNEKHTSAENLKEIIRRGNARASVSGKPYVKKGHIMNAFLQEGPALALQMFLKFKQRALRMFSKFNPLSFKLKFA